MQEVFKIVESLAVTLASCGAILGLWSWRSEAKWKRKADLAEAVLLAFYKVELSFSQIRKPWITREESLEARLGAESSPEGLSLKEQAMITFTRYQSEGLAFDELRAIRLRYRINFKGADEDPFAEVEELLAKVLSASLMLGNKFWPDQGKEMPDDAFQKHLAQMHELESWHWKGELAKDPLAPRLSNAIKTIEKTCGRYS